jgi:hypothetical protein
VSSYNLLLKLPLEHKSYSHSSSLSELLSYIISLINTSNITRTKQIKHIKNKAKAITVAKVFREALEAIVTSKAIAVSGKVKIVTDISCYLYIKRNIIFITS